MNEIYDRVFINENYRRQFQNPQDHARAQSAQRREVPESNIDAFVMMEDTPDGGVTITTGDFVAYFNQRCGGDRIGAMRRSVVQAQRRCELNQMKKRNEAAHHKASQSKKTAQRVAYAKPRTRFSFVGVVLGLMLILSIGMLFGTSALLENAEKQVADLEKEVAVMQEAAMLEEATAEVQETSAQIPEFSACDSVEIYPAEEDGFAVSALLNALAALGQE